MHIPNPSLRMRVVVEYRTETCRWESIGRGRRRGDVLLLSDPLACFIEAVGADEAHGEEVVGRAETARGEVALWEFSIK